MLVIENLDKNTPWSRIRAADVSVSALCSLSGSMYTLKPPSQILREPGWRFIRRLGAAPPRTPGSPVSCLRASFTQPNVRIGGVNNATVFTIVGKKEFFPFKKAVCSCVWYIHVLGTCITIRSLSTPLGYLTNITIHLVFAERSPSKTPRPGPGRLCLSLSASSREQGEGIKSYDALAYN